MVLRVRGTTIRDTMLPFCLIPMAITFRRLIAVQWNDPLMPSSLQHLNRYRVDASLSNDLGEVSLHHGCIATLHSEPKRAEWI